MVTWDILQQHIYIYCTYNIVIICGLVFFDFIYNLHGRHRVQIIIDDRITVARKDFGIFTARRPHTINSAWIDGVGGGLPLLIINIHLNFQVRTFFLLSSVPLIFIFQYSTALHYAVCNLINFFFNCELNIYVIAHWNLLCIIVILLYVNTIQRTIVYNTLCIPV